MVGKADIVDLVGWGVVDGDDAFCFSGNSVKKSVKQFVNFSMLDDILSMIMDISYPCCLAYQEAAF